MKRRVHAYLIIFAVIALLPSPAQSEDNPSGPIVYSQAMEAMRNLPMPRYITYRLTAAHHGLSLHFRLRNNETRQFLGVDAALDRSAQVASGAVRYDSQTGAGAIFTLDGKPVLTCAPFPLSPEVRSLVRTGADTGAKATTADPMPNVSPLPDTSSVDVLGQVGSVRTFYSAYYTIVNSGVEQVNGKDAFHLRLTARDGNTSDHPVTDLFVDTKTHLVDSVVLGGGQRGLIVGGGGYGRFDFTSVGDYWIVNKIHIEAAGHMLVMHQAGSLDYTFDNFEFPQNMEPPF